MAGNSEESGEIVSKPRVSVRTLSGDTHHFDVQEPTTVEELKRMIQTELDIPVEIQRLLFQGKILQDGQTLKEAHCFNKVIHLVKRAQPPPNTPPTPTAPTMDANVSSTTTDTPQQPSTTTPASSVMFGAIPPSLIGATQQMFNDMWQSINSAAVNTSTSDTATPPTSGATTSSSQAGAQEANNRALNMMLVHTRQLLLHCQKILDRFDRGESISAQDVARPALASSGPAVSMGASLLSELYQQLAAVHERLQPLLREQARFLSEDLTLDEQGQQRVERLFACLRGVLESLNVCEKNLASVSVSSSQPPPRTLFLPARTTRTHHHVVIGTPHVSRVHVNIEQTNATRPTAPTITTGSAPPQPQPQPQLPGDIANIVVQTLNSLLPEGAPPLDLSAQGANPPTAPGEAVFIQNDLSVGLGANLIPSILQSAIPMDVSILQLVRMMHPSMEQESGDDLSSQLIVLLCGLVTVSQLRDIGQGRVECLQAMYPRIREFVFTKLLPEEGNRGVEEQGRAARRLIVSGDESLDELVDILPDQVGVDLKETFVNFLYINIKSAIALVLDPRNQEPESRQTENRFGKVIWGWGHNMLCEMLQLVEVMARAGSTDVHAVIEAYLHSFDPLTQAGVAELPLNPLIIILRENRDKIDSIIRNSRLSSEQIKEKYFVQSSETPSAPALPIVPTWLSEEWQQCLEEDKAKMEAGGPSICFSNSYMSLSGLSAEKGETVSCSAEDVLCETLTMSINTSQVSPATSVEAVVRDARQSSSLKKRYSEFIDSNLKKRLRSDPNFSGERFPNAADKFKPEDP